jgi:hypothetical protein
MPQQIIFFEKNYADLQNDNCTATASQGNDFSDFVRNRKNSSGWITTNSVDSDNTTFTLDFSDSEDIDQIILLKHNFAAYTVEYWNGSSFVAFSPAISVSGNTAENTHHSVTEVSSTQVRLTVTGTITPDEDKQLAQFIVTKRLGQMAGYPEIKKPTLSRNRSITQMLSGKSSVVENLSTYSTGLSIKLWSNNADLTLIENLYDRFKGFLFWPSGGDETQFSTIRQGYRLEDIYLCKMMDEYVPEYFKGVYSTGIKVNLKLAESVD